MAICSQMTRGEQETPNVNARAQVLLLGGMHCVVIDGDIL